MGNNKITGVNSPFNKYDVANKEYVDSKSPHPDGALLFGNLSAESFSTGNNILGVYNTSSSFLLADQFITYQCSFYTIDLLGYSNFIVSKVSNYNGGSLVEYVEGTGIFLKFSTNEHSQLTGMYPIRAAIGTKTKSISINIGMRNLLTGTIDNKGTILSDSVLFRVEMIHN